MFFELFLIMCGNWYKLKILGYAFSHQWLSAKMFLSAWGINKLLLNAPSIKVWIITKNDAMEKSNPCRLLLNVSSIF